VASNDGGRAIREVRLATYFKADRRIEWAQLPCGWTADCDGGVTLRSSAGVERDGKEGENNKQLKTERRVTSGDASREEQHAPVLSKFVSFPSTSTRLQAK
jgi:hypothetical protein